MLPLFRVPTLCQAPGYSCEQDVSYSCVLTKSRRIGSRSSLKSLVRIIIFPVAWGDGTHILLELKVLLGPFPVPSSCSPVSALGAGPFKKIVSPLPLWACPPIISQLKKELAQNGIVQTQLWAPRTRDRGLLC